MKRDLYVLQKRHSMSLLGLCWLILTGTDGPASADLGTLVVASETQHYRISVLTLPTPLRVGPAVFNIAVRDLASRQPSSDADVLLILTPPEDVRGHDAHHHGEHEIRTRARQDRSRHPGFSSAVLDFSDAGSWNARVVVQKGTREESLSFVLQVGPPSPPWLHYWAAFGLPAAGGLIFIWHQRRVLGRAHKPSNVDSNPSLSM